MSEPYRIYLMTDMEGSAGILNHDDWVLPTGRYYDVGREFLTLEVNAAVEGFLEGGATEVVVADGHGAGGIDVRLLHPSARLMRGWPTRYPLLLDKSYDAIAFVGQHAKAGTEYSHITHTQWFDHIDLSVNGISIGEFGQFAMCASELGIPTIFGAGEKAFVEEASALVPDIETVSVKEGTAPGRGDELSTEEYRAFHLAAIHHHPVRVREWIRDGAMRAIKKAKEKKGDPEFGVIPLAPPFRRRALFRHDLHRPTRTVSEETHPDSVIRLMNLPYCPKPLPAEGKITSPAS